MSTELFFITMPCEPAKGPDPVRPIYELIGYDSTGAARCRYRCPHCGGRGPRYQPIARHMGLVQNVKPGCRVLLEQDKKRRASRGIPENMFKQEER